MYFRCGPPAVENPRGEADAGADELIAPSGLVVASQVASSSSSLARAFSPI